MIMKFFARSLNGKFEFAGSRSWVRMRLSELPDGEYDVEIKRHFKKRSNKLNSYYWAVVVPMVYDGLIKVGYGDEVEDIMDAHEVIKSKFFKKFIYSEQRDVLEKTTSTTKFNNEEFNEKLELIWKWAFEFLGIIIPPPNGQSQIQYD